MLLYKVRLFLITFFIFNAIGCSNTDTTTFGYSGRSSGFSIKGISMVAPKRSIDSIALQPILNIHANSIAIMPYAFCTIENPEVRYNQHGQHWGESINGVIDCIRLAHQKISL